MASRHGNIWHWPRRIVWAFAVSCLLTQPASAIPEATGVRVGQKGPVTRIVLDLSERIEFRAFTLANPYRLVLDMPMVDWRLQSTVPTGGGDLVMALRFGRFTPHTSRVVLDVSGPIKVERKFVLPPRGGDSKYRLVIDMRPVSEAEFTRLARERRAAANGGTARRAKPLLPKPVRPRGAKRVVVLDPGHGGIDPGTIGRRGTKEKTVTLALAREVKRQLEATGRYKVVLTRERDYFVRLRQRVAKGRQAGGDLFLSLHADSIKNRRTRGATVYTLSEKSSDAEAAALAAKENRADLIAGVDLANETDEVANILIDLAQRETMNLSARFANVLIEEMRKEIKLLRKSHRYAGFAVLKAPDVPSVLIEVGYLSNRIDEGLLRKVSHRRKLARGVVRAVDRFFRQTDKLTRS
jgi:N-acetylmuramoyl-L-alanine amidase